VSTRESDPDIRSARRSVGDACGAAVSVRDELDDREPETRAAATPCLVGAAEAVEGPGPEVLGKAGTSVPDMKLDEAVAFLRGELDGALAVCESVVNEVHERLPDAKRVRFDADRGLLDLQLPAELMRATREAGFFIGEQVSGGDDLQPDRQRSSVGPGD